MITIIPFSFFLQTTFSPFSFQRTICQVTLFCFIMANNPPGRNCFINQLQTPPNSSSTSSRCSRPKQKAGSRQTYGLKEAADAAVPCLDPTT